jgi:hypothetical protein
MLLAEAPMSEGSKTKSDTLVLQVGGWAWDLQPHPVTLRFVSKPELKPRKSRNVLRRIRRLNMDSEIGNWNVQTLLKAGIINTQQLSAYGVKNAAIQETSWTGEETRDTKSRTIFNSGKERKSKEAGVAFLVDAAMRSNILKFAPIDGRLCSLRVRAQQKKEMN